MKTCVAQTAWEARAALRGLTRGAGGLAVARPFCPHSAPQIADEFVRRFSAAVDALKIGLPWQPGVSITPLPEPQKPALLQELTRDAIAYGPVPAAA